MDNDSSRAGNPARYEQLLTTLEGLLAIQATGTRSSLTQASNLVAKALEADKVDVFVYDPAIDTLVALGTSDTSMGRKQKALGLDRLPRSNGGTAVHVFETGQPYRNGHVEQDPEELPGVKGALGVRSAITVALNVDGTRRGALQVDSAEPETFIEDDVTFLQAVAYWVGMVLHRSELVERISQEVAAQTRREAADELIAILAHDLRGPLTPLSGYIKMMRDEAEQAGLATSVRYADASKRAVARLLDMIVNLLDSARLEQGLFALNRQVVDLVHLARETCDVLDTSDIPIVVRGPEALVVEADPDRLRQALENLLSNARKHSPKGADVIVELAEEQREDGPWAKLTVRDAGPGIAPEMVSRLFTRFARSAGSQGLGLGLYLVRGIAEAHAGTLTVESAPGKGASFCLALPHQTL
jgi:two-component system, OmpR family, sensor kinase